MTKTIDPLAKSLCWNAIEDFLYSPVTAKLANTLNQIIIKNTVEGKYSHRSFRYKGKMFISSEESAKWPRHSNHLLPHLRSEVDAYMQDSEKILYLELTRVKGFVGQVLNSSNLPEDYFAVLPEVIHPPLMEWVKVRDNSQRQLSDAQVVTLQEKGKEAIELIKQRVVLNLIL